MPPFINAPIHKHFFCQMREWLKIMENVCTYITFWKFNISIPILIDNNYQLHHNQQLHQNHQNQYIHQSHQNCQNHVPVCNSCCMPINLVQSTFTFESEFGTAVRCLKVNRNINLAHLHKCIITGPFQSSYFDKPIWSKSIDVINYRSKKLVFK